MINRIAVLSQLTDCPVGILSLSMKSAKNRLRQRGIQSIVYPEVNFLTFCIVRYIGHHKI